MTYKGRIKNGVVVFDEAPPLPDGAEVEVKVAPAKKERSALGRKLLKFAGKAKGLPPDMAKNHDHYLYGLPKK
jgi:hypothetical protein